MLAIGGVVAHLELEGAQPTFIEQMRARYGAFAMPASRLVQRDLSLRLTLSSAPPPGASGRRAEIDARPLAVTATGRSMTAERWDFSVKLTAEAGSVARVSYRGSGRCEMNPLSVDCLLRSLYATILPAWTGC